MYLPGVGQVCRPHPCVAWENDEAPRSWTKVQTLNGGTWPYFRPYSCGTTPRYESLGITKFTKEFREDPTGRPWPWSQWASGWSILQIAEIPGGFESTHGAAFSDNYGFCLKMGKSLVESIFLFFVFLWFFQPGFCGFCGFCETGFCGCTILYLSIYLSIYLI